MSCCLHSECLLTGWIKGSGRLLPLLILARAKSWSAARGHQRQSLRCFSGLLCLVPSSALQPGVQCAWWCVMQLLVLVLGSRTSNPHLLLAQAQAQAALGIQKTGNLPEDFHEECSFHNDGRLWEDPLAFPSETSRQKLDLEQQLPKFRA